MRLRLRRHNEDLEPEDPNQGKPYIQLAEAITPFRKVSTKERQRRLIAWWKNNSDEVKQTVLLSVIKSEYRQELHLLAQEDPKNKKINSIIARIEELWETSENQKNEKLQRSQVEQARHALEAIFGADSALNDAGKFHSLLSWWQNWNFQIKFDAIFSNTYKNSYEGKIALFFCKEIFDQEMNRPGVKQMLQEFAKMQKDWDGKSNYTYIR